MDENNTIPEQVAPDANAAESQVVTTETVTTSPETQSEPEAPLYAGKYKSVEEMERGYKELESKLGRQAPAKATSAQQVPEQGFVPAPSTVPQLDPEAEAAVRALTRQEMETARVNDFTSRHAAELADPVLRGTLTAVIQQENAEGRYISQDQALQKAQELISSKAKPQVAQAESQGFNEGLDLARSKERAGAIGDTSKSAPPVDESKMSAAEYLAYKSIPRYQG